MIRIVLEYLLPLLLPTLVWLAWAWLMRHARQKGNHDWWQEGPWFWLVVAGFVALVAVLGMTAVTGTGKPGQTYEAPYLKDGQVVPGQFQ